MKVLHIYKTYLPDTFGGVEQVIQNICRETAKQGCENTILTLSSQARSDNFDYVKVIRYPITLDVSSCPMSIRFWREFKQHINQADIIHYHFPWPFAELLHIGYKINKPNIVTYHSDIIKQRVLKKIYNPLMKRFLTSVDQIIVTSPNYSDSSQDLKFYPDKIRVIPIGIDKSGYPQASSAVIRRWQKQVGTNFLLFIGVLRYYKGLFTLLEAARGLQVPIVIVGDGPLRKALHQRAQFYRLSQVHFTGAVSEMDKVALLQLSRAVVLPSHLRSEAFGVSLVEGLAFGKPLISTEIGTGTSYVNQNNVTGFVVPGNDPNRLKTAMNTLYHDEMLAKQMGRAGLARYKEHFSASLMGERYAELYKTLVNQSIKK
jgi:glycosyltransferase involved in cell wall biosynthesis